MNKSTFTAQLRIEAIVAEAQKELTNFGNSLRQAWQGGEPPKSLMRTYEEMRVRLESLKQISEKGLVDTSDLRQAKNDFKAFQQDIHNLTVEFKLMSAEQKRAMLSTEEQAAMKARTVAVKEYTDAIKKNQEIIKQRKPLEEQRATIIKEQQPRRTQLQTTLADVEARKARLDSRGPVYNKDAEQYAANAEKAKTYTAKIKSLELKPVLSKKDAETLETYKNALKEIDLITGKADWEEAHQRHREEVDRAKNAIEATIKEMEEMDSTVRKLDGQLAKLNPVDETEQLNKLKERLKELGVEGIDDAKDIDTLRKAIQQLDDKAFARVEQSLKDMNAGLNAMGTEALQVGKEIDASTEAIERQNEALRNQEAFEGRIKQFLGMTGAVELLRRSMISAFNTIKELDAAMTEMAVVTDTDISGYWDQLPEYTERANELGLTIKDVYQADTLFYQQGLKTNEVVELSTQTMRMARVAGLDTAEATDRMTAALRGFNMELNEANAQKIADVYSELAAITASDVDEISSAMTKTASIAANAGMEFETTAAFLSQIIETTRESAETAGTAMKTVIARFQELKKDPAEIGEVDGEIVDANKIETALRSVGVALRDANGQFRDLDDVFLELAQKWSGLDTNTQRYIATIAAGSRQQSRFIAMMSDYSRTQELVSAATNSAGANQEQFEKTMESLSAKLNELKNAWNEFSMGILESDLVKAGVDILTTFLKVINKATSAFDGLGGSIMKIITIVGMFKMAQKIFTKIKEPIMNVFSEIVANAFVKGKQAAESYAEGAKQGAQEFAEPMSGNSSEADDAETPEKKKTFKEQFTENLEAGLSKKGVASFAPKTAEAVSMIQAGVQGKKTMSSFNEQHGSIEEARKKQEEIKTRRETAEKKAATEHEKGYKKDGTASKRKGASAAREREENAKKEAEEAAKEYEELTEQIKEYEKAEADAQEASQKGWSKIGDAIGETGANLTAIGVGVSLIGGLFSSLGLGEVGEVISTIGTAITFVGTALTVIPPILSAIPPLLTLISSHPIVFIIVAVLTLVLALIIGIASAIEKNSLENRMNAAAEATQKAREAAEAAKEAYDELLEDRSAYDEAQKALKNLVYGTKEWKNALMEANTQVLDLITKYPELAAYMEKGEYGQLVISDEGFEKVQEQKMQVVRNSQALVLARQMDQLDLRKEEVRTSLQTSDVVEQYDYTDDSGRQIYLEQYNSETGQYDYVIDELAELYNSEDVKDLESELDNLHSKYGIALEDMQQMYVEVGKQEDSLKQIAKEAEAIAKASLMTQASQELQDSGFAEEVTDIFAVGYSLIDEETRKAKIAQRETDLKEGSDYKDSDEFKKLADQYGVTLTGQYSADLKNVYKAVTGKTEEDLGDMDFGNGEVRATVINELASISIANETTAAMEELGNKLQNLNDTGHEKDAQRIAGLLSSDGAGLTREDAKSILANGELDTAQVESMAAQLGYESASAWAEAMGLELQDFYDTLEDNAKDASKAYDKIYQKLNKAGVKVENIGEGLDLSLTQTAQFGEQLIGVLNSAGPEAAMAMNEAMTEALKSVPEENREIIATMLGTMNWHDAASWDQLQQLLEEMGEGSNAIFSDFITNAKEAAGAMEIIDFSTLVDKVASLYEILNKTLNGNFERQYSQEEYEMLITGDESLKSSFVQLGDQFIYVGQSIDKLSAAILKDTVATNKRAAAQLEGELALGTLANNIAKGENEKAEIYYNNLASDKTNLDIKKSAILDFIGQATEGQEAGDLDILRYLTNEEGQSLGLSANGGFDIDSMSEEFLNTVLQAIGRVSSTEGKEEELREIERQAQVSQAMFNDFEVNVAYAKSKRGTDAGAVSSQALLAQASMSGVVAESVLSAYAQALEDGDTEALERLENSMSKSMKTVIKNQAGNQAIGDLVSRTAQALEANQQKEIDTMQEVADATSEANQELINKLQEQIDTQRKQRQQDQEKNQLEDMQSRLAYLQMDSSGGNALATQQLEQQLEEAKQNYQDTLIDQKMSELNDAAADAANQRERQIRLAQEQLDISKANGDLIKQAQNIVNGSLQQINNGVAVADTEMGQLLTSSEAAEMSDSEKEAFAADLNATSTTAANAVAQEVKDSAVDVNKIEEDVEDIPTIGEDVGTLLTKKLEEEEEKAKKRAAAVDKAAQQVLDSNNWKDAVGTQTYTDAKNSYIASGGSGDDFDAYVKEQLSSGKKSTGESFNNIGDISEGSYQIDTGSYKIGSFQGPNSGQEENGKWHVKGTVTDEDGKTVWYSYDKWNVTAGSLNDTLIKRFGTTDQKLVLYNGTPYVYSTSKTGGDHGTPAGWRKVSQNKDHLKKHMERHLNSYKTGGLADFTGPAWLDGTKSHPELVLNARDTQNFIQLKDILAHVMDRTNRTDSKTASGDNYYDIEINVESIDSDYDVEQMANKIRSMIYNDATYRNVNAIQKIR